MYVSADHGITLWWPKYEFNPEMSTQSSLSQPESAGSAFSNAAGPFFNGWSRPVGYILTRSLGNS